MIVSRLIEALQRVDNPDAEVVVREESTRDDYEVNSVVTIQDLTLELKKGKLYVAILVEPA